MGGAIICSWDGSLWQVFQSYGHGVNDAAEFWALLEGLNLCRSLNVVQLDVETDAKVIMAWLTGTCNIGISFPPGS